MQNHAISQYQSLGPGFDNLMKEIEAMLQVYSGIAIVFTAIILSAVVCLLICELRESKTGRTALRSRPFNGRELTDTGF
ncbi:MAG TPA: hypothetical protein VE262_10960 [Blastocatellia bacterium]|nr:hypothetical protein [Blastocatellia bacterium]